MRQREVKCNINVCDGIKTWKIQRTESSSLFMFLFFLSRWRNATLKRNQTFERGRQRRLRETETMNFVVSPLLLSPSFVHFVRSPLSKVDIKFLWKRLFRRRRRVGCSFSSHIPHPVVVIFHLFLFYLSFNILVALLPPPLVQSWPSS